MSNNPLKIYKSSAGSGKTYTLVLTYLSILLQSKDPYQFRKILAVTFTNKAAQEMKERVVKGLEKLQSSEDTLFVNDYVKATGLSPSELSERAQNILTALLHDYGSFSILTIDKFVHRIIRSFARELGLTNNFELETNTTEFFQRSIDQLLSNIGIDTNLTDFLVRYNQSLFDEEKATKIEVSLLNLAKLLEKENSRTALAFYDDKDLNYFIETQKKISAQLKAKKTEINEFNQIILKLFEQASLNPSDLKNGKSNLGDYYVRIKNEDYSKSYSDAQIKMIAEGKWMSEKGKKDFPEMASFVNHNIELLTKNSLLIEEKLKEVFFLNHLYSEIVAFSLLNTIRTILNEIKADNNIVFINDFNTIISKVIQQEQTPYIYEKIGARYSHFLIDEFQDTSTLQWHNLVPLIFDSLASNHTNLIVGDAKQAIYRFRGGEVDQFIALPKVNADLVDISLINNSFERNADLQVLDKNYRSSQSVINFNNWFFENFVFLNKATPQKIKQVYEDFFQHQVRQEVGLVHITSFEELKGLKKEDRIELIHKIVHNAILDCLHDGYSLDDICLLVRSKDEGKTITDYLVNQGFNIVSADSILLNNSVEVMQVMHHFQAINHPIEAHIIKCILETAHYKNLSATELFEKYRIPKETNSYYSKGFRFDAYLIENLAQYDSLKYAAMSIFDKIDFLIQALGFKRTDPFIDKLLNVVFEFMQNNGSNGNLFITHFFETAYKEKVNAKNNSGSIQLMTIHKSKGLQFPVVMLPYDFGLGNTPDIGMLGNEVSENIGLPAISAKLTKSLENIGFSEIICQNECEKRLDITNLYYVAFTRPEDRLYFIQSSNASIPKELNELFRNHEKFNPQTNEIVIGKRTLKPPQKSVFDTLTSLPNTVSWRDSIKLSPSMGFINDDLEDGITSNLDQMVGNYIHEIIAQNNILSNLNETCNLYLIQNNIPKILHKRISKSIAHLASNTTYADCLKNSNMVFKERDFISKNGTFLRPDMVIFKEDELIVIDFKSGSPKLAHHSQINQYGEELMQLKLPNRPTPTKLSKYLIYLSEFKTECIYV